MGEGLYPGGLIYGRIFCLQVNNRISERLIRCVCVCGGGGGACKRQFTARKAFFCHKFKIFSASILFFQPAAELTLQPPPVRHHQAIVS